MTSRQRSVRDWGDERNPQACLVATIASNEFERFCDALKMGGDPTKALPPPRERYCAFEYALRTKGRSRFVEECIKWGCSPCYINRKLDAAAIHHAAQSEDPLIVEVLLQHPSIDVNRKYKGQTPLNILIDNHIERNVAESDDDFLVCIEKLLDYGASPNMPNKNDLFPIKQAMEKNKVKLIELLLKSSELEIDPTMRSLLSQNFPGLKIPTKQPKSLQSPIKLKAVWESKLANEAAILSKLKKYLLQSTRRDTDEETRRLNTAFIEWSIEMSYKLAFDALQQIEFDVNSTVLETALKHRNSHAIKQLILYDDLSDDVVSKTVMEVLWSHKVKKSDVQLCCDKVKENFRNEEGFTLLSVVDLFACEYIIQELLKRGEYIGARNPNFPATPGCINDLEPGAYALRKASADLLEQHFDTCILTNSVDSRVADFEILIDYQNLIPPTAEKKLLEKTYTAASAISVESIISNSTAEISCSLPVCPGGGTNNAVPVLKTSSNILQTLGTAPGEGHFGLNIANTPESVHEKILTNTASQSNVATAAKLSNKLQQEIDAIAFFTESPKYKHLIKHPVVRSFIFLKWHCISRMFYLNVGCYVAFWLSMLIYAFLLFVGLNGIIAEFAKLIYCIFAWIFTVLLTLRELFQLYMGGLKVYLRSIVNITECCLIICAFTFLVSSNAIVAVIVLLLMTWELGLLLTTIPIWKISTLMLMWKTVLTTFLKCFLIFSAFLVNFSMVFLILSLRNGGKPTHQNTTLSTPESNRNTTIHKEEAASSEAETESEFEFNKFPNIWAAVLKTIVMLTGEFDASSLELNNWFVSLIFLLFVILITIVLSNLLYGLAVSDTQEIQCEAELSALMNIVRQLKRYVKVIESIENSFLQGMLKSHLDSNGYYSNSTGIAIRPNKGNKVRFLMRRRNNSPSNQYSHMHFERQTLGCFANTASWLTETFRKLFKTKRKNSSHEQLYSMYLDTDTIKLAFKVIERKKELEIENQNAREAKLWQEEHFRRNEEKHNSVENRLANIEQQQTSIEENMRHMKLESAKMLNEILNCFKVLQQKK